MPIDAALPTVPAIPKASAGGAALPAKIQYIKI